MLQFCDFVFQSPLLLALMLSLMNFFVNDFLQALYFMPHFSSLLLYLIEVSLDSLESLMLITHKAALSDCLFLQASALIAFLVQQSLGSVEFIDQAAAKFGFLNENEFKFFEGTARFADFVATTV